MVSTAKHQRLSHTTSQVDDLVSVDLSPYFPEAIEFISMGLQKGAVLVHWYVVRSRACQPTLLLVYCDVAVLPPSSHAAVNKG